MSDAATIGEVFNALCSQLAAAGEVAAVSSEFARLADDRARVEFAHELLKRENLLPCGRVRTCSAKDDAACKLLLQEADNLPPNAKKKLYNVLQLLTKAVAHGVAGGKYLGQAYIERSDVLYELELFDNCIEDLQLAAQCANANTAEVESKLESARLAQSKKADEVGVDDEEVIPRVTHAANSAIACAGDSVTIKKTIDCGRFVAATKDIQIGEVIAVEKAFVAIAHADPDVTATHCQQCLRMNYAPVPCDQCTFAMYCSAACKSHAWKHHHQFECLIVSPSLPLLTRFAIRLAIITAPLYDVIETYPTENDLPEERYESDRYKEIHNLCTNTPMRSVADLFRRSVTAALIYELVEANTTFFSTANDLGPRKNRDVFKGLLLRHMQTGPSNFHTINEKLRSVCGSAPPGGSMIEVGAGAYSFLSMVNHSCAPNVMRHCYGATTVLRAIRFIRQGEELLDNYGYHFAVMPRNERRQQLKSQYLFDCNCEACKEDWPFYHDLKIVAGQPDVSADEIAAVEAADRKSILRILDALIGKARVLTAVRQPAANIEGVQECIKECYSRLANKRFVD